MSKDNRHIFRLKKLFAKYLQNKCSASELSEFWCLLSDQEEMNELDPQLQKLWQSVHPEIQQSGTTNPTNPTNPFDIHQKTRELLERSKKLEAAAKSRELHRRKKRRLKRLAAVAIIFVALGLGTFFWINGSNHSSDSTLGFKAKNSTISAAYPKNRLALVLADGKTIDLAELGNGAVVNSADMGLKIRKTGDGELTYDFQQPDKSDKLLDQSNTQLALNRLITPGGKRFKLVLSDGTRVWLNGRSSIQFPNRFTGPKREVTITGEAYFEVAHLAKQPFIVHTGSMDIQVLGTHFNVNAYADEPAIKTTLLEGLVRIEPAKNKNEPNKQLSKPLILHPGQQLKYADARHSTLVKGADIHAVMSWKEGKFIFENEGIDAVMRTVARWYDIEVKYDKGQVPQAHVSGEIARSKSLGQVLKMLELAEGARFEIKDRTVIVHTIY